MEQRVAYPYLPDGKTIGYVPRDNKFMALAKAWARAQSLDEKMPGAAVVVKDGRVIGIGANGSTYHKDHGCERVRLGCKSGQGYDLCEGCNPKNHSEPTAIRSALAWQKDPAGADLYLWGHWWFCKDCWAAMEGAGIANVFVMEESEVLFNKDNPANVVDRQFELA